MSSQQSPPIKLNNASFCRVLEGYANDVEKHGRPLDNGLPSVLRDCVERLKSDEAKLEELQGGVYCTNRRVAGGPCGELTARIQERDEALSKLDEYEHRAKLHMDRCQHDMERIVRLEQQLEKCEAERAKYERWFYEKFGQAFEAEEDLDALLEANRVLQAKLDRYRTALKAVVDACDLPDADYTAVERAALRKAREALSDE